MLCIETLKYYERQDIPMQNLFLLTAYAEGEAAVPANSTAALVSSFFPLILMIVVFYFLIIRPQKKRDKQFREMLAAIQVGDNVVMSSGIEGRVITVKEDSITIETGADRVKLTYKKWAVKEVTTQKA